MESEIVTIVEQINKALGPQAGLLIQQYAASCTIIAIVCGVADIVLFAVATWALNRMINIHRRDISNCDALINDDMAFGMMSLSALLAVILLIATVDFTLKALYPELNMLKSTLP